MIRGLYAAARGMVVESKKQEVISNNLANINTTGYKKDFILVESFTKELLSRIGKEGPLPLAAIGESPLLHSIVTNFSPGVLEETGRSLDLALTGPAFFALQTPEGLRYTKDGSFGIDSQGYLVSSDGYYVLDVTGQSIRAAGHHVVIDGDGAVFSGDGQVFLARLWLPVFSPDDLERLEKRGQNLFEAVEVEPAAQGIGQVRQGALEKANLDIIREMVDMITVMRIYEANQRSLQAQDELLGKSINEVGRLR